MNTYEHITQNRWRSVLLVILFPVTFAITAGLIMWLSADLWAPQKEAYTLVCDLYGNQCDYLSRGQMIGVMVLRWVPVLWLVAMGWIFISYFVGDSLILSSTKAVKVTRDNQPELYRLVENLAITRGLPTPTVYVIDDDTLNAFATGRDPQHASIAFTRGILQRLERVELEGVAAHELAHIENRDIRLMLLTVAGISFFTLIGEICLRIGLFSRSSNGKNDGAVRLLFLLAGFGFLVYGYVIAPLIRLAVSRQREYQADATAALTTRNPLGLANALRKISGHCQTKSLQEMHSVAAMCIANPVPKSNLFDSLAGLFATHPPIEERIRRLEEMNG